eukprot:3538618-Pleurochrysis_carterae.AAC.1
MVAYDGMTSHINVEHAVRPGRRCERRAFKIEIATAGAVEYSRSECGEVTRSHGSTRAAYVRGAEWVMNEGFHLWPWLTDRRLSRSA